MTMSATTITRDGSTPTSFQDLSIELQLQIWTCALPGPRIIQLHYLNGVFFFRGAPPPLVLHICRASREVGLKVFESIFDLNDKPIYINFAYDTLHLATSPRMCKQFTSLYPGITEKIESLAVEITSEEEREEAVINIVTSHLSKLRELIFVAGGGMERMLAIKYPEKVMFLEPEPMPDPWRH
ncbi:uncharacterized protein K444DRAFT_617200 [Hyaloscypha bicolor E]|uniref:2EXR domain-containing protein n=1 Tax=Hyaloscypha bicolor E TaxID=1095630 RepID=A0A2J6SXT6_9HELO|nr:uncharacterized protein K444DRAFT_617200 [Hyaloscypha bicolor E]PMD55493.1 hypothetical protein K444DRAFT_617200 [Hyaloscypha bicolor E]